MGIGRARTSCMPSVVRITRSMSSRDSASTSSRWRWRPVRGARGRRRRAVELRGHPRASATGSRTALALDLHAVLAVDLLELDVDDLLARRRHVLAHVVGADRELAVAAVDEDREADRLGPPEVDQRVHRRPDRAARVQDVVDEDDRAAVEVERDLGALDDRLLGDERQVVAVEGDVERADGELGALVLEDRRRDAMGERDAAALDADQDEALGAGLLLHDLVRDAGHRAADVLVGHDPAAGHRRGLRRRRRRTEQVLLPGLTGPPRPHGTGAEIEPSLARRVPADRRRRATRRRRRLVDRDRDPGRAGPRRAAADLEEVRAVHVDDPARLLRAVVGHGALDAAARRRRSGRPCRAAGAWPWSRCRRTSRTRTASTWEPSRPTRTATPAGSRAAARSGRRAPCRAPGTCRRP